MMLFKKLAGIALLLMAVTLSACNLSQSGAAVEMALNPSTFEASPTRTPIPSIDPTRTAVAAPTITVLGGDDLVAQSSSQNSSQVVDVAVVPTQPPPKGICSLKPTGSYDVNVRLGPGADFGIVTALRTGQYAPVLSRAEDGWFRVNLDIRGQGWVSPKVVTLYGPCNNLPVDVVDSAPPTIETAPSLTPTPTAMFGFSMNIPLNHLITKTDVGSIPAGTTVMVSTTQFTGSEYLYAIMTADGRYETVRDSQLAYSAAGGTLRFPTPTPYVYIPSATVPVTIGPTLPVIFFQTELYMMQYRVATTTRVGNIPAGTAVRLRSPEFNGSEWTYLITTRDDRSATALESQLAYIPNAGGGGPTPTEPVVASATAPVMELPAGSSASDVVIPDGVCTVTAQSATRLVAQPGSSTVVGVLSPGPWAQVDAKNGQGWYKVTIWTDGSQGWTTTATVTLHGPCDSLPIE